MDKEVAEELVRRQLTTSSKEPVRNYFVTDDSESFRKIAEAFFGSPMTNLQRVDLL